MERVLKEVTEKFENITTDPQDEADTKRSEEASTSTPKSSLSNKLLTNRMKAMSPLSLDRSRTSLPSSPGVHSPVFISINRTEERDIVDPRNVVMSSESSFNNSSMSRSYQAEEDPLNTSSFCYETPNLIKFVRVDVPKLRLPPTLFVGSSDSLSSGAEDEAEPARPGQSQVEEEIVRYELERLERAEKRVQERKAKWEQQSREKELELREELERSRRRQSEEEEKVKTRQVTAVDLEKRIEQTIKIQLEEREERQRSLILLAKKEEELAREKQQRKIRIGQQMEKLAPLQTQINQNLKSLLELWTKQEDRKLFSDDLSTSVPKLVKDCDQVCEEARTKVTEGECGPELFDKLTELKGSIVTTTVKIEKEIETIAQKKEEEKKAEQQKLLVEEEEKRKAAEEKAKQELLEQEKQKQAQTQVISTLPVTTPAPAPVPTSNTAWYEEILKFKSDFIKNVVFTDQEKQFKFDLQKAVNTPLNSLSAVSSAHLKDKVDKLVSLLSGEQVTVGERTISVTQHQHAKSFCMGLAAKKLAKQGEDVVTADHRLAFPAATLALAIWDKFPDFGKLLLAYMFEMCPFLVPHHPQRTTGQSDKEYNTVLGYKYEKEVVESQDKYLKRMSGLARLYAAISVSHLPRSSPSTSHPHPPARLWTWFSSLLSLTPQSDVTATIILDILEVSGHTMFASYGKQFGKLLGYVKKSYFSKLEAVKSEPGPTVRLEQFLTSIGGGAISAPDGALKPGFL